MAILSQSCPLHRFHARCGRCGFTVDGEIRNGRGGWNSYAWEDFSRACTFRTARGVPSMICPHLRSAKLAAQPLPPADEAVRVPAQAPAPLRIVARG